MLDIIAPRTCCVCGGRLKISEEEICSSCNLHLPRTRFARSPYDNPMTQVFWIQTPVEKAAALFYYNGHSDTAGILYHLKYHDRQEIGLVMGRMLAEECKANGFFDGIDVIVPIPLAKKRLRQRGYNQSEEIARGISEVSGLPVDCNIIERTSFAGSQTKKDRQGRIENVDSVFHLKSPEKAKGKHLLIVDDVVTTGATIIAAAKELAKAGEVKISILSLGFAHS